MLANDADPDGGPKTITAKTDGANGTVVITGGGSGLTYQPAANFCGTDNFTYTLNGGSSATVTVTVTCVEDDPTAVADSASVAEDSGATAIDVLANDTDPDGGAMTITAKTDGSNGTVVITGGGSGVTYEPAANFCGSDSFTYTLNGGSTGTVDVTVTCVDDAPVAVNDAATVNEDAGATAVDVLANDTDVDGGPKTITAKTDGANGAVVITGGGSGLTYHPAADFCGADSFTYTLNGGSSATVSVTVSCVDDAPVAVNDTATIGEDAGATAVDVLANDTDPDGGPKVIEAKTDGSNGTVVITGGGSGLTYEPAPNFCGSDSFTYTLNGGSTATVDVTVTCVDDAPVAVNDAATVLEDAGATAIDVLANDTDVDGGPKTITAKTDGSNGTVVITGGGTGLTYAPGANFCGSDSFTYTLNGGSNATVAVTVTCVNDAPSFTAGPSQANVANQNADGSARAYTINPWATGISAGPANESGQTVDFVIDSVTPSNLFTVQPAVSPTGVLTFTTNPAANGTATIVLHIHDNGGTANGGDDTSATQSFTIQTVFPPPVAVNDSYTATGNVGINVTDVAEGVLQRGTDDTLFGATITNCGPTNAAATAVSGGTCTTTSASGGNVVLNVNGTFTYDPPAGFTGADHFFYKLTNPGGTAVGDVTVTVSDMIWFVKNDALACTTLAANCGRLSKPFSTLAAFQAVNSGAAPSPQPGQTIFLYTGLGAYTEGVTLRDTQLLIGQGATASITAISGITLAPFSNPLPPTGGTHPNLTTSAAATNAITLGSGNTVRGLDIGNKTGSGIAGTNFGTLTLSEVGISGTGQALNLNTGTANATFSTLSSSSGTNGVALTNVAGATTATGGTLTGSTGDELLISGAAGSFTYPGAITNTGGAAAVNVNGKTGGTIALSGPITDTSGTGDGISLSNNSGATINLTGGVSLSTGTTAAFTATGGGTINVTGSTNTLTTTTGTALNVANTTIGASDLTFQSISANGAVNGIVLNNTGTSGGLTVTGSGAANSGGTIQNSTGDAIVATNTQDLSLSRILVQTAVGDGINASNLRGTNLLANSTIQDFDSARTATKDGLRIVNMNTNLTLFTVTGTTFNGMAADAVVGGSNDGVFMEAQGTSTMALSVEGGSAFTEMFGDSVQVNGITGATGTVNVTVKDSTFTNATVLGNGGLSLNPFGGVNLTANIENNTFDDILRPVTNLGAIGGTNGLTATANITIRNNTLNNIVGARGISFTADGSGLTTLNIDDNDIDRLGSTTKFAISVNMINSPANVRVTNNRIGQAANLWTSGNGTAEAIFLLTQNSSTMTSLVSGNVVTANATLEVIRARATSTSSQNVTFSTNTVTDSAGTHVGELAVATGTGTVQGGTICMNASANVLPAAGVGVILLSENTGGTVNVTQASSAALSTANSNATVTIVGAPAFGAAACPTPP